MSKCFPKSQGISQENSSRDFVAVLSDRDIRKEITNGNIILYDPDRDCHGNIQNCSVDITLGPYYYRNNNSIPVLNPWNQQHIYEYWGTYKEASIVEDYETVKSTGLNMGDKFILLHSGESILAHTREFVGGLNFITSMIKARSSMGRCNITICRDAGWGDINFYNRWTLEITNSSTSIIILPVGARIGQIIFFYTGAPDTVYSGKYQNGYNLQEIVKNWHPSMLLPKAFLDK